ncbi:NADP-dependent oxidoreductase domain-containing protein [Mycena pura]|uniref:NADP-dependent oxidoreductase domain-containing protein n=1 Tax=Mycena pura TaxID=153505 RepID=A0AAD6UWU1_9AGAR|nr:NADP-dependent oxidoreductase domain-containing protein [Mycena pura]
MPFGTLPLNDGKKIPAIAFGTGSIYKHTDVTRYVQQALDAGFEHIDTAQVYDTEEYVGNVIRDSGLARSDLYITTKYAIGDVRTAIENSLKNLGLEFVDLYLIHGPGVGVGNVWKEFESIQKDGLAKCVVHICGHHVLCILALGRSIGVSNHTLPQLQHLVQTATVWPAVNQVQLHPYSYAENKALLEWAAQHGIVIEAYGSLSSITTFPGGPVDAPVAAAAARLGISPTQVLFAWVRAKGAVIVTTTSSKQRLEEYLAVGDLPPLSAVDVAAIDAAGARGPPTRLRIALASASANMRIAAVLALLFVLLIRLHLLVWRD